MANDPASDLEKAHATLVNMRRNSASALARGSETGDAVRSLIQIQDAIEAIDRAALDEKHLASKGDPNFNRPLPPGPKVV